MKDMINGRNDLGTGAGTGAGSGAARVLPHIDDLLSVRADIDSTSHVPITKLLQVAETYAKQADTHLDFRRPDLALEEYIKASNIIVEDIPRHKDYPQLLSKAGPTSVLQQWTRLQKRIYAQHEKFEEVKTTIKLDNQRTGVAPRSKIFNAKSSETNGTTATSDSELSPTSISRNQNHQSIDGALDSTPNSPRNGVLSSARHLPKPNIKPKPNLLLNSQGKVLHQKTSSQESANNSVSEDLAARFASLRSAQSPSPSPVQDPRIRTRPIIPPSDSPRASLDKPTQRSKTRPVDQLLGPRPMPNGANGVSGSQKPKFALSLDTDGVPAMPRPPDAIYSPARGLDDPTTNGLPRSASRNSIPGPSRTNSIASLNSGLRTSTTVDDRSDYFARASSTANLLGSRSDMTIRPSASPKLPDSTTISAADLYSYLQKGYQVLLVDIRDRTLFDDGHIMARSIICIEPIVLRHGISGDDLEHAMVLSPELEQKLFDKRADFDLLVYYDQSSTTETNPIKKNNEDDATLRDFSRAVFDYSYEEKQLKRKPTLLAGGLDAWIDLVGLQALATSETSSDRRQAQSTVLRRKIDTEPSRRRLSTRRLTYEARPLTSERENEWNATLKDEEVPSPSITRDMPAENWSYARTQEDFFRKYPDIATQESMVVPHKRDPRPLQQTTPKSIQSIERTHQDVLDAVPRPPTRPSPAVPRPSYGGISDRDSQSSTAVLSTPTSVPSEPGPPPIQTLGSAVAVQGRTGLVNFGNTCYMNAVLQSLSATRFLSWYLMQGDYEKATNKPQRKPGEMSDPPQLMAKSLANLMRHLWNGQFTHVTPKTFRNYIRDIHSRDRDPKDTFGGSYQQDAAEFLVFMLQLLDDELNSNRHLPKAAEPSPADMAKLVEMPPIYSAIAEWNRFFLTETSPINRLFGGQYTVSTTCKHCGHCVKRWDTWIDLAIPILETRSQTLDDALKRHFAPEALDDYKCEGCNRTGGVIRSQLISRCPDYMIIDLKRATDHKIKTQISFDLDNLDMTPHFVSSEGTDLSRLPREQFYGYISPFKYKCYAVIQHEGQTIDSGHYWTLVRDMKENTWWEMNDNNVLKTTAAKTQTANSYILFYKRI